MARLREYKDEQGYDLRTGESVEDAAVSQSSWDQVSSILSALTSWDSQDGEGSLRTASAVASEIQNADDATGSSSEAQPAPESDLSPDTDEPGEKQTVRDREPPPPGPTDGLGKNCLLWIIAGVVLVGAMIGGIILYELWDADPQPTPTPSAIAYRSSTPRPTATYTPTPTASATPTPSSTPTVTPTPTPTPDVILVGIEALGELNTVQYDLEAVVEKRAKQERGFPWPDRHLHFLLVAGGRVKAGVDFKETVRYTITDNKVTVYLSAPRITDYSVDMQSLEIYYIRDDGLDEKLAIEAYNQAIVDAQESLREAALRSDILETARTNATALVQSLVLGLGFAEVEVNFLPPRGDETLELDEPLELIPTLAPFLTMTPEG